MNTLNETDTSMYGTITIRNGRGTDFSNGAARLRYGINSINGTEFVLERLRYGTDAIRLRFMCTCVQAGFCCVLYFRFHVLYALVDDMSCEVNLAVQTNNICALVSLTQPINFNRNYIKILPGS